MMKAFDHSRAMSAPIDPPGKAAGFRQHFLRSHYKLGLVALDLFLACAVALAWTRYSGREAWGAYHALLTCCVITPLLLFPKLNLYSYHRIFLLGYHLSAMIKALGYGLVTWGLIVLNYEWIDIFPRYMFMPLVLAIALAVLFFHRAFRDQSPAMLNACGLACMAVGVLEIAGFAEHLELSEFLAPFALFAALLLLARVLAVNVLFSQGLRRRFRRQVLVIGEDSDAEDLVRRIIRHKAPFWVAGTVGTGAACAPNTVCSKSSLGRIQDLERILGENFYQEAFIMDERMGKPELIRLLDFFTTRGINVWFPPKLMPILEVKLRLDELLGLRMVRLGARTSSGLFRRVKYSFDAVVALAAFIGFLPVFLFISAAIKLNSPGPVFYRPTVVGKGGRGFRMFKFRSMVANTSTATHKDFVTRMIKGELTQDGSGKTLKIVNDPRVTSVGRLLRKTSLDELPQLMNVLMGEMSLVGPRPCLPYEYAIYSEWHKRRADVRPGITGLWQVVGRSEVGFEDMILLDLYYVYNRNLQIDLAILFQTVIVVLKRKGAH
jgi:exopolysaccharide biosynthesis polyprenyl glycosylphosphotransferase